MSEFRVWDPLRDFAEAQRRAFLIRGLAKVGRFVAHPDHDAGALWEDVEILFDTIEHLSEGQVNHLGAFEIEAGQKQGGKPISEVVR